MIIDKKINGNEVIFENGHSQQFDTIIMCTGYKISLDFLEPKVKSIVFEDKEELHLNVAIFNQFIKIFQIF